VQAAEPVRCLPPNPLPSQRPLRLCGEFFSSARLIPHRLLDSVAFAHDQDLGPMLAVLLIAHVAVVHDDELVTDSTRWAAAPLISTFFEPGSPRKMYVSKRSPLRQLAMVTASLTRIPQASR